MNDPKINNASTGLGTGPPKPPEAATLRQWLAVIGGIFGALIAIIDIGISTSSLQAIQGTLATSIEETSWITTSYLIAEIVAIPLAGWFSRIVSVRRYLVVNTIVFILASFACGMSRTLSEMIVARAVQGFSGGCFIPLAMQMILTILPLAQRPVGLLLFSLAGATGPVIGPFLGGWITYHFDWTYSYNLQIVPCSILIALIVTCLDETPMKLKMLLDGDWIGIGLLSVGLGTLTYVLEEGNRHDWLDSRAIAYCSLICVASLTAFIFVELRSKNPLINLRLYKSSSFTFSSLANLLNGIIIYGNPFLFSRFLFQIQNYDSLLIGQVAFHTVGLTFFIVVPLVPFMAKRIEAKVLACIGLGILFLWAMLNSQLTHHSGYNELFWPQVIRALGAPMVMTALTALAFIGISPANIPSASGVFSSMRQMGGSIGVALLGTILDQRYRFHFSRITERIEPDGAVVQEHLDRLTDTFAGTGVDGSEQAIQSLGKMINREALVLSYSDAYFVMQFVIVLTIVSVLMIRKPKAAVAAVKQEPSSEPSRSMERGSRREGPEQASPPRSAKA